MPSYCSWLWEKILSRSLAVNIHQVIRRAKAAMWEGRAMTETRSFVKTHIIQATRRL